MLRERQKGIIIKSIAGFYYIEAGASVFECRAKGRFRIGGKEPLTGDNVFFEILQDGRGVVSEIVDRKNELMRPPLANIERLYVVMSMDSPRPNLLVTDKLIAIAEEREIEPVIVLNKSDLADFSEINNIYSTAGFETHIVSCIDGTGIDQLKKSFCRGINAFTGNSGVGKSSIMNLIDPSLALKTGEISQKLGRGRHTTRCSELFSLGDGVYIADTAGFSSVELAGSESVPKENLAFDFREFAPALGKCRFTSCSHTGDKGCAVTELVNSGNVPLSRYENYKLLYNDVKDVKEWEK